MQLPTQRLFCVCLAVLLFSETAKAQAASTEDPNDEWGDLIGQFVFDGPVPERPLLDLNKDVEYCMKTQPRDESLLVNAKNKGLANVIIWLEPNSDSVLKIHPQYDELQKQPVRIANKDCIFQPRVAVMWTKQELVMSNEDDVAHNMLANLVYNQPFNLTFAPRGELSRRLPKSERVPGEISCSIHAWMRGRLLVKDHPYAAVSDRDGRFAIRKLPAGEWTFAVWHEQSRFVTELKLDGQSMSDEKGRYSIPIGSTGRDLGQISISSTHFRLGK